MWLIIQLNISHLDISPRGHSPVISAEITKWLTKQRNVENKNKKKINSMDISNDKLKKLDN